MDKRKEQESLLLHVLQKGKVCVLNSERLLQNSTETWTPSSGTHIIEVLCVLQDIGCSLVLFHLHPSLSKEFSENKRSQGELGPLQNFSLPGPPSPAQEVLEERPSIWMSPLKVFASGGGGGKADLLPQTPWMGWG